MKHTTRFEDDGFVGVLCNGKEAGTLDIEYVKQKVCPVCEDAIALRWDVRIEELLLTEGEP